jgi:hypothetical protein
MGEGFLLWGAMNPSRAVSGEYLGQGLSLCRDLVISPWKHCSLCLSLEKGGWRKKTIFLKTLTGPSFPSVLPKIISRENES